MNASNNPGEHFHAPSVVSTNALPRQYGGRRLFGTTTMAALTLADANRKASFSVCESSKWPVFVIVLTS